MVRSCWFSNLPTFARAHVVLASSCMQVPKRCNETACQRFKSETLSVAKPTVRNQSRRSRNRSQRIAFQRFRSETLPGQTSMSCGLNSLSRRSAAVGRAANSFSSPWFAVGNAHAILESSWALNWSARTYRGRKKYCNKKKLLKEYKELLIGCLSIFDFFSLVGFLP